MDEIRGVWTSVENVGVVVIAIMGGILWLSLNLYLRTCSKLKYLEEYLIRHKTIKGFKEKRFALVDFSVIDYAFKSISEFDKEFLKYRLFRELFWTLVSFRKFYKVAFSVWIIAVILGIAINTFLM